MGLGLLLGAVTVGYGTDLADLALMGALTGLVLGPAQALALPRRARVRWVWAAALPVLWALGWTTTTLGGIAVDQQFTVFGAYGAVTFSALSGLLLHVLLPYGAAATAATRRVPPWRRRHDHPAARHLRHRRDRTGHPRRATPPRGDRAEWSTARAPPGCRTTSRWSPVTPAILRFTTEVARGRERRLPDPEPALPRVDRPVPAAPDRGAGRRRGGRRPPGQHGERLHVRTPGRTRADRGPRIRGAHHEGDVARPDGPRPARRP